MRYLITFGCVPAAIAMYSLDAHAGAASVLSAGLLFEFVSWKRTLAARRR